MWRGTINNELSYGSQFETQRQEQSANFYPSEYDINLMRQNDMPNGNIPMENSQQFNTEDTISYLPNAMFPVQGQIDAMFAPQVVQQPYNSGFVNEVATPQSFYGAVMGHRQNNTNFEVDDEAMLSSGALGFPYGITSIYHDNINHTVKRKSEDDYSPLYTGVKRRITDEHMATGMNSLYITNEHNYACGNAAMFNPDNDIDMQFSTVSDDLQDDDDNIDQQERREYPVFQFAAPLEQMLKKKTDILPAKIIEEIYKPCLAMVPWTPPLNNKPEIRKKHQRKQNRVRTTTSTTLETSDELEDESLIL